MNVLIGIDQLGNAIIGGDPDHTISGRLGKAEGRCKICRGICKVLGWIDKGHCEKSIEWDEGDHSVWKW